MPPGSRPPQEARRLGADCDQAWDTVVRILAERGYEIRQDDREAGTIETEWRTINPDYTASILVTQNEDRYSACGQPGFGQTFRGKQVRLTVMLSPVRRGVTDLTVQADFRTDRRSSLSLSSDASGDEVACHSRGRLEDEIAIETQVRALSDHLNRTRRGVR
ncbi:MAG: outer membrane protein assembly factor BamC [candidate division NC10 bacterium]